MQEILLVEEEPQSIGEGETLADNSRQGRSLYAHSEAEYEYRVQYRIEKHREYCQSHCHLWMSRSPDDIVQAEIQMGHHIAQQDYEHVVPGVWQCVFAGAEEAQNRRQEGYGDGGENEADDDVQQELVGKDLSRGLVVALAQEHGQHGGGAHAHKGSEGSGKVHQRECDSQTRYGIMSHPRYMPDENAVHHIVQ